MVNLSWESLVTGTIPISLGKRVICTLEEGITYCFPEKLTCFQNEKAISKKLVTKQKYCEYIYGPKTTLIELRYKNEFKIYKIHKIIFQSIPLT